MTARFSAYKKGKGKHLCAFGHDKLGRETCATCVMLDKMANAAAREEAEQHARATEQAFEQSLAAPPDALTIRTGDGEVMTFGLPKRMRPLRGPRRRR